MQQDAGGQEADHGAPGCDSDPGTHGLAALLGWEDRRDNREGDGHDQCRRHAQDGAERNQRARRMDEKRRERGNAEQRKHGCEQRLAPEAVTDRARGQEQGREDDRVGVDDPLELSLGSAGVPGDPGQRDVEAGDGCHDHHHGEAHDPQNRCASLCLAPELDRRFHAGF